ncbi:hypothetical protein G4V62_04090 [Bacillaceae bacterium SIJ1]|uniref:hypothetical protein n=1 Tax=Litoribacterium kuwaitense TaxID=1398745 RepID=UPI0013EB3EB3|nr:hypothetical protein [Litoribacterium kuwaitense]NGP44169.1 hypothetical protein [Litoribacterium kuwaitense]
MWRLILVGLALWILFTADPVMPDQIPSESKDQFQLKLENDGEMSLFQQQGEDQFVAFAPDELIGEDAKAAVQQMVDALKPSDDKAVAEYVEELKAIGYESLESFQMLLRNSEGLFTWVWPE